MKNKGFSLIELLIVILIIAILVTMMTFSLGSSEDAARANNVITNMANIKMAANIFYFQHPEEFENKASLSTIAMSKILPYLSNFQATDQTKYDLIYYENKDKPDFNGWWVRYELTGDSSSLRYEIADRVLNETQANFLSYNTRLNLADKKNIQSNNRYLILKVR